MKQILQKMKQYALLVLLVLMGNYGWGQVKIAGWEFTGLSGYGVSPFSPTNKNANVSVSKEVGKKLAERAVANGVTDVVFDRSGYLYHGNVKALADGAREGGLKF